MPFFLPNPNDTTLSKMSFFEIAEKPFDVFEIYKHVRLHSKVKLSETVKKRVQKNRAYLDAKISDKNQIIYGINTGFGSLCDVQISQENLEKLQENLVVSHACGMGEKIPENICATIILLKIINLSHGYSGVRLELIEKLIELYNAGIYPLVYEQGSLGASGDLAPLAHMSLPLLGKGLVYYKGEIKPTNDVFSSLNIETISLTSKEGLALLNGTQFSLAHAISAVSEGMSLFHLSNRIAALSMEAFQCDISPYNALLHIVRPHEGQKITAKAIYDFLIDSPLRNLPKTSVQDPYSFRCVPQVHGASYQALSHAMEVVNTEINSVTDNPMVFDEDDLVLSGGNFHAQPLALVLDYLAIALAELGSISERRVYQLINGDRGLPAFLTKYPGLDSGFMIAQYTAASIVSQSKQYCTPASIDSIVSSKGQEDHVSMAANAATKIMKILSNLKSLIAIEWLTAAQAIEFRRPATISETLEKVYNELRSRIPMLEEDRLMHDDMMKARELVEEKIILDANDQ